MGIKNVIVPAMGFTEREHRRGGIRDVWRVVRAISDAETWVLPPQRWRADARALAGLVAEEAPGARCAIFAHSWGVGVFAVRFAAELLSRGVAVTGLASADGVFRSRLLPDWLPLNALSLSAWPRITVPRGVGKVWALYQRQSIPKGQAFRLDRGTRIEMWREVRLRHQAVDESPEYLLAVRQLVLDLCGKDILRREGR